MFEFKFGYNLPTFVLGKMFIVITPGIQSVLFVGAKKELELLTEGTINSKQNRSSIIAQISWNELWLYELIPIFYGINGIISNNNNLLKLYLQSTLLTDAIKLISIYFHIKYNTINISKLKSGIINIIISDIITIYAMTAL